MATGLASNLMCGGMKTNLLALIFLGLLSACATVEGLGEDIQAGGEALSNAANSAQDDESGGY